jgi:hypoxanthine phosphoribosyltransferase
MPAAVLLDADAIAGVVAGLADQIAADHAAGDEPANDNSSGVVLVGVLKGALPFVADLARALHRAPSRCAVTVDFISISRFAPDSGRVKILQDLTTDIGGRDVVIVEDIVDTGLTLAYLLGQLEAREPRSLSACALLDRPGRRIVPLEVRYRGVELGDEFVLGYGLHVRDLYRNLPFVVAGDRAEVAADAACYVQALYPNEEGAHDGRARPDAGAEAGGRVADGQTEVP